MFFAAHPQVENDNIENGVQIVASAESSIPISQRVTTPYLTKYERARILGTRALQLRLVYFVYLIDSMNAPPMVEVTDQTDTLQIAMEELKQKKVFDHSLSPVLWIDSPDYSPIPSQWKVRGLEIG